MTELDMACAELKLVMSNNYAVERYVTCTSPKYTHPGWVELQHRLKQPRKHVYGNC